MQSTVYRCGELAKSSAAVCPPPSSTLLSRLSTGSPGVYMSCHYANFAEGASVAWLIETVLRILSSSIVIVNGDTLITIEGPVFGGTSLLYKSVPRRSGQV